MSYPSIARIVHYEIIVTRPSPHCASLKIVKICEICEEKVRKGEREEREKGRNYYITLQKALYTDKSVRTGFTYERNPEHTATPCDADIE